MQKIEMHWNDCECEDCCRDREIEEMMKDLWGNDINQCEEYECCIDCPDCNDCPDSCADYCEVCDEVEVDCDDMTCDDCDCCAMCYEGAEEYLNDIRKAGL